MEPRANAPTPSRAAVLREQVLAIGVGVRLELFLFIGLLLVAGGIMLYANQRYPDSDALSLIPEAALPLFFLALAAPLAVWKEETPARRGYHLAMPVPRAWHQLVRSSAGWVWVMAALALYFVWVALMAAFTGGEIGVESTRIFIGSDWDNRTDADFLHASWPVPAWQWAVPIVGATAIYLAGSALVLAVNHPWRWGAGIYFALLMVAAVTEASDDPEAESALESSLEGRYGLHTLLTGETLQDTGIPLERPRAMVAVETPEGIRRLPLHREQGESSRPTTLHRMTPDRGAWTGAALLWTGLALAAFVAAAHLRRDA